MSAFVHAFLNLLGVALALAVVISLIVACLWVGMMIGTREPRDKP